MTLWNKFKSLFVRTYGSNNTKINWFSTKKPEVSQDLHFDPKTGTITVLVAGVYSLQEIMLFINEQQKFKFDGKSIKRIP